MGAARNGRNIQETQISCIYQLDDNLPHIYPTSTGVAATAVAGHANVNTWGNWVSILPAATIDADASKTHLDIHEIEMSGITSNSELYFELQYNSVTFGRGYYVRSGTGQNMVRNQNYKSTILQKVAGQDVKMRIMSDQAGESVDVGAIMWCEGVL
jgi:hypothetical protein